MATTVSSPLVSAFNNIAAFNSRTKRELPKMQQDYESFSLLIDREKNALNAIELPKKRKIKELQNLNVASTFGNPGGLLSNVASGALDAAGFLGSMFPPGGKPGKQPVIKSPKKPRVSGTRLKFGPLRSIGILNAIFAGLDFATGLQEGESVGQAAAGAGGSLAGGILGGMIGQALIPIPGLGFVVGSIAGDFLGGYGADRAVEALNNNQQKESIEETLKEQKENVDLKGRYDDLLRNFKQLPDSFMKFIQGFGLMPKAPQDPGDTSMLDEALATPLEGENTFIQGNTGKSRGDHFHIGPDYEVYGKPEGLPAAREGAYKIAKNLLSRKIPFTFTNARINVNAENPPDDATLQQYIKQEQNAHMSRSSGSSHGGIDIAAPKGTTIPGIKDVREIPNGFGVQGRIAGTQAFVGHGAYGSKSSPDVVKKEKLASISSASTESLDIIIPLDHVPSSLAGKFPDRDDGKTFKQSTFTGAAGREREHQDPAAEMLKKKLAEQGYNVAIVKPESFSSYQAYDRYIKSQSKKGVRVLPLHFDAKGSTGFMTITRGGDSGDADLAAPINTALSQFSSSNPELGSFRTSTQGNATVNAGAASPTALVELGVMVDWEKHYGKNFTQTEKFDEFIQSLSTAIGKATPKRQIDPNAIGGFEPRTELQRAPEGIRHYPSYSQSGGTTVIPMMIPVPSSGGKSTPSVMGGSGKTLTLPMQLGNGDMVNSLMKKIFLTNLNDT
jgi:hypothetical protein